jgi:putative FmdB family regulatory protein
MPLYEYLCESCGHRFEVLQRMGDGAKGLTCPKCGESKVEKQFSTFASSASGTASAGFSTGARCGGGSGFS